MIKGAWLNLKRRQNINVIICLRDQIDPRPFLSGLIVVGTFLFSVTP
jgi:hypothetical protein